MDFLLEKWKEVGAYHLQPYNIELIREEENWDKHFPTLLSFLQRILPPLQEISKTQGHAFFKGMTILLTNDAKVHQLNKDFRFQDKPTNVLSFPSHSPEALKNTFPEEMEYLGDIALSYETILKESEEQGKSFENHMTHLTIHGILHLMGFDHIEQDDRNHMESLEISILGSLNIPNPYEDY